MGWLIVQGCKYSIDTLIVILLALLVHAAVHNIKIIVPPSYNQCHQYCSLSSRCAACNAPELTLAPNCHVHIMGIHEIPCNTTRKLALRIHTLSW